MKNFENFQGDSGGPLLFENMVVGINKGSCPKIDKLDLPVEFLKRYKVNIHVRVDYYQQFIEYILQNYV